MYVQRLWPDNCLKGCFSVLTLCFVGVSVFRITVHSHERKESLYGSELVNECFPHSTWVFFQGVTMPLSPCIFARDGKACHYEFSCDGHTLCVPHRPCVDSNFVYDPERCDFCTESIKFFRSVGKVDRLSNQFVAMKKSWDAVQRSAKRKGRVASWKDDSLRSFVLGKGQRAASHSAASSTTQSSPAPSLGDESQPGPSPSPSEVPPTPATPPPAVPSGDLTPQMRDFIKELFTEFASAFQPPPPTPTPEAALPSPPTASNENAPPPPQSPHEAYSRPPTEVSVTPAQYTVDSSPVSDASPRAEVEADQLADSWVPVPGDWNVLPQEDQPILLRHNPTTPGTMEQVPGLEVRWGVSVHVQAPTWHFRTVEQAPRHPATMPCPSADELLRSFSTLGVLAGLPAPVITPDGEEPQRRPVGLPWVDGQMDQFLRSLREWWTQSAARPSNAPLPRPPTRQRPPMIPHGASLDSQVGTFLAARHSRSFPLPLATPSAEVLRTLERDRAAALELFSGFQILMGIERLLVHLTQLPTLPSTLSSSALCAHLTPLVRAAAWQLSPTLYASVGQAMASHMTCWRQAVAPLPAPAQSALLLSDPLSPAFGSTQAVADAIARTPQVAVVFRDRGSGRSASSRSRGTPPSSTRTYATRQPPSSRQQPSQARYRPYQTSTGSRLRPATTSRDRRGQQAHHAAPATRRTDTQPFRVSRSGARGARR